MAKKDPRIDAYIEKSADFAKPILEHFRELVHKTCPDVEETMKWSFPHFDYRGQMMCSMASFKKHAVVGFWKASLMTGNEKLMEKALSEEAMGHLGKITSLKDLPKDAVLKRYIKEAMRLNDEGVALSPRSRPTAKQASLVAPDYFMKALSKNKKALKTFEGFSPSNKREYVSWVVEAKTEATREKRLADAVAWMSEGKIRHWKYNK